MFQAIRRREHKDTSATPQTGGALVLLPNEFRHATLFVERRVLLFLVVAA